MIGNSNSDEVMKYREQKKGFTLVEVLVAVAVLSIILIISVGLLMSFFNSQRIANDTLFVESQARQMITTISERIRDGYVDYNFYTGLGGTPSSYPELLAIRDSEGIQTVFWFYTVSSQTLLFICDDKTLSTSCSTGIAPISSPDWDQVNNQNVYFSEGEFEIQPDNPPYMTSNPTTDNSPLITVIMQLQHIEKDIGTDFLQTSFTTRFYAR